MKDINGRELKIYDCLVDGKFLYIIDCMGWDKPYIYLWDCETNTKIHEVGRKNSSDPFITSDKKWIGSLLHDEHLRKAIVKN